MIILYGIANCDTIRKTRKWLDAQNCDYQFHDYKKLGCSSELAKTMLKNLGIAQIINTRGTTWRNLAESEREPLNDKTATQLMQKHPSLIKRPVLRVGDAFLAGFDCERMSEMINQRK